MVRYTTSERGFRQYEPIQTSYGHEISVYESSAADAPHIWVKIELSERAAARVGLDPQAATAHLTLDQANALRDAIDAAIEGHYQTRNGAK